MKNYTYILLLGLAFVIFSCQKDEHSNPTSLVWKQPTWPSHFPAPHWSAQTQNTTQAGFELGRKLFYDPILSRNNTISCASCHIQGSAFSHHGHDVSHGINDQLGRRNAPALQNMLWQPLFFWDGGVHHIDLISLNPIQNPVEMDEDPQRILEKLQNHLDYPVLFQKAFGSSSITTANFLQAMTQFLSYMNSTQSPYDLYRQGKNTFSNQALQGLQIFQNKCVTCHSGELFSDFSFRNNGILSDFSFDQGRYEISLLPQDIGKFKVPSLRNIALTAPYMHNGSFYSIRAVLDHYDNGVKYSNTLDTKLQEQGVLGIPLTEEEKDALEIFLHTLTDTAFIHNKTLSEPF